MKWSLLPLTDLVVDGWGATLRLTDDPIDHSEEFPSSDGLWLIVDFSADERVVGLEVLWAESHLQRNEVEEVGGVLWFASQDEPGEWSTGPGVRIKRRGPWLLAAELEG